MVWGSIYGKLRSAETWRFIAQCPREGCDGSQAFFYQVQIRSADEPMTTFYKVSHACLFSSRSSGRYVNVLLVYDLCAAVEGKLSEREHGWGKP